MFPKRHRNSHQKTAPLPFSPVQHPPLPKYTHENFHPNDNLTTQHDTLINNSVTPTTDTPIKIYSRVNYPFAPPSSRTLFQSFANSLPEHSSTPSSLETLVEVHLPQSNNTSLIITVLKNSSTKVDKSTR